MSLRENFAGVAWHGIYGKPWHQFFKDLYREINEDNVFNGSAALGYYFTLAVFPAMLALLSLLPYIPTPNLQTQIFDVVNQYLPKEAADILTNNVQQIVSTSRRGLLSIGAVLTLWAASAGVYAIMQQLNITYDIKESRSYFRVRGTAILLTVSFGLLIASAFLLIVLGGNLQNWMDANLAWSHPILFTLKIFRWIVIPACLALALALIFYFGPNVEQKFKYITPGSVLGTVMLIFVSVVFKAYVANFGNYNATYGSIGAVIILMLWLNILGLVILIGSEVNALIEHYSPDGKFKGQKAEDSPVEQAHKPLPPRQPAFKT